MNENIMVEVLDNEAFMFLKSMERLHVIRMFRNPAGNAQKRTKRGSHGGFAQSFGGWEGEDMTMDEIKDKIKANRKFKEPENLFA
ncbi:MAG: hypothetical protein LBU62_11595 [Bacteroidales bacterium]|nr:hypothetical protein [Bacteroidales bacterium]